MASPRGVFDHRQRFEQPAVSRAPRPDVHGSAQDALPEFFASLAQGEGHENVFPCSHETVLTDFVRDGKNTSSIAKELSEQGALAAAGPRIGEP